MTAKLAQGILKKIYVAEETAFNTYQALASADALAVVGGVKLTPEQNQEAIQESIGTASAQHILNGAKSGAWEVPVLLAPNGAGVAPQMGALLKAAFGNETIVGGTSVEYTLSDEERRSLLICERVGDSLMQLAQGAWVENFAIDFTANTAPRMTFSGGYASHIDTHGGLVGTGGALIGASTIPINSAQDYSLEIGSVISIGTNTNGGDGHRVTAVDWTANTVDISPVLTADVIEGDAIAAITPAQTLSGTPIGGCSYAFSIDGVALGISQINITDATGLHGLSAQACETERIAGGVRAVTMTATMYFLDEKHGTLRGQAWESGTHEVILQLGSTAGSIHTATMPAVKIAVIPAEIPEAEETTIQISGTALMSAAAGDELSYKIT